MGRYIGYVSLAGLSRALRRFDENGKFAKCGDWEIAKGGYDLWWELYYQGNTIMQCVDGKLEGSFGFDRKVEEQIAKTIQKIFGNKYQLQDSQLSEKEDDYEYGIE